VNRRQWLFQAGMGMAAGPALGPEVGAHESTYRSPYRLKFRVPLPELEVGFDEPPWYGPQHEAAIPAEQWYGAHVRRRYGAWGPPARQYPPAPGVRERDATWLQDRVILAASRWIGYPYQHHHIPDWNPPSHWPWHRVAYGRNSKGIDCSNFSSFCYNYALGIKLDTGIRQQAARREVRGPGGRGVLAIEVVERMPYRDLIRTLQPADLLYIRNNAGKIAHVIM
jgi:cell wall-associated NlpC family hydrolase